jgi:glycosyltransferase involved in cell wall biosynthesis
MTAFDVILPVRNGSALLDECLRLLTEEVEASNIVVIDDASHDDTTDVARRHGARVISQPVPQGPYHARNTGYLSSNAGILVFTDVRCRPRAGWAEALVKTLNEPGVVIAGCDVTSNAGVDASIAERWAMDNQPLRIDGYLEHLFLPYVPTACLAIRRDDLVRLGGFDGARSGGDADLCWRAQQAGMGTIAASPIGMWSRPRNSSDEVVEQFRRYAQSAWELQLRYGFRGDPPEPPSVAGTSWRTVRNLARLWREPGVALLDARRQLAFERAFRANARAYAKDGQGGVRRR